MHQRDDEERAVDAREGYALGLMAEEMGETLKLIGKALRFGLDAPGPDTPEYRGQSARQMLPREVGDLHAAIRYAACAGLFSMNVANESESAKFAKLTDPASLDAQGNRLAPALTEPRSDDGRPVGNMAGEGDKTDAVARALYEALGHDSDGPWGGDWSRHTEDGSASLHSLFTAEAMRIVAAIRSGFATQPDKADAGEALREALVGCITRLETLESYRDGRTKRPPSCPAAMENARAAVTAVSTPGSAA